MRTFKHIIITRFNLPQRWNADKQGKTVLDSEWLKERFELFEKFCLPSIIAQTSQNFEWWVYFDINTDNLFKKRIESIEREYKNFKPKFEHSYEAFEANMPKDISQYLVDVEIDWLITTRLDNDDMLARNTVKLLQKNFSFNNTLLEIPYGYTLELIKTPKLRKVHSELNPFISYIENIKEGKFVRSVYYYQHSEWKDVSRINVSKKPQWVQIIHEKNVFNRALGKIVFPYKFKSSFNFEPNALIMDKSIKLFIRVFIKRINYEPLEKSINKLKLFFK